MQRGEQSDVQVPLHLLRSGRAAQSYIQLEPPQSRDVVQTIQTIYSGQDSRLVPGPAHAMLDQYRLVSAHRVCILCPRSGDLSA